jgi:L-fuconolactonase
MVAAQMQRGAGMPGFPIVDAHVHLWDPQQFRISWLDGNALLARRYDLNDYATHTAGTTVDQFVYLEVNVDPAYALLEARQVAQYASQDPRLQAIVAWAPLEDGAPIRSYLEALVAISPLIRGVRRVVQGEPDPNFSIRPGFVEAVRLLPEYGLTCDLCIKHPQLPATIELVRSCPEVTFMLDHIAKPDIAAGLMDPWRAQIRELASLPNVWCKVSGMVTEADHRRWAASDLAPYVAHVLECFGEDRVVFGGDWPVVLLASSYIQWVETLDQLTSTLSAALSAAAKKKLWADNARRFYRFA